MDIMAYPTAIMSFSVTLGLFILRRRERTRERPFKVWIPVALLFLLAQAFLIVSPFIRPKDGLGDTTQAYWLAPLVGVGVVIGGLILWWIWRIVIPYAGYFFWVPQQTRLYDGTMVTKWKKERY
jgi:L-type amino acid transporter 9